MSRIAVVLPPDAAQLLRELEFVTGDTLGYHVSTRRNFILSLTMYEEDEHWSAHSNAGFCSYTLLTTHSRLKPDQAVEEIKRYLREEGYAVDEILRLKRLRALID